MQKGKTSSDEKPSYYRYRKGDRDPAAIRGWELEKERRRQKRSGQRAPSTTDKPPADDGAAEQLGNLANEFVDAARKYIESAPGTPRVQMYGQLLVLIAQSLALADPKDRPKILDQLVATAKLIEPSGEEGGDDGGGGIFGSLGTPT